MHYCRRLTHYWILVFSALSLLNCNTVPIRSVEGVKLSPPPNATLSDVQYAVRRAGEFWGWSMVPKGPGTFEATRSPGSNNWATVQVRFDMNFLSIQHLRSSSSLEANLEA